MRTVVVNNHSELAETWAPGTLIKLADTDFEVYISVYANPTPYKLKILKSRLRGIDKWKRSVK